MTLLTGENLAAALDLDYEDYESDLDQVAEAAVDLVAAHITESAFDAEPAAVKEATLSIAVEMFQARTAAGGQPVGVDMTPGPYKLSIYLTRRVQAVLAPYLNAKGMVG